MKLSLAICFSSAGAAFSYQMLAMKMCFLARGPSSLCLTTTLRSSSLSPKRSSVRAFALQVCSLHQDDEEIHGARAERYDLCAICQKSAFNSQIERAEAQDFPALIARGIFLSMPALEVTSPGIPRSRRQWAGL
jgi:hypothetical protein